MWNIRPTGGDRRNRVWQCPHHCVTIWQEGVYIGLQLGLITGCFGHSCTSFASQNNERVKLYCLRSINITNYLSLFCWSQGALTLTMSSLSLQEVYRPSLREWREVPFPGGYLPRPFVGMGVVTLNNRVFLFGQIFISTG